MPTIEEPFQTIANGDKERLIDMLADDPALIDARNAHGDSPLLYAAYRRHRDLVDLLMEHGAVPTMFEAAAIGDAARVEAIVAAKPAAVHDFAHDGWTALHLAAHFNHRHVAELLLSHNADINAPSSPKSLAPGNTPLHSAVAAGHRDLAAFLLERGANPNASQSNGLTPLHLAALDHTGDFVHLLADRHAMLEARDATGATPLALALKHHREAAAQALLARGAVSPLPAP